MEETFPVPKAYAGNHLPFIGFTFTREYRYVIAWLHSLENIVMLLLGYMQ